MSTAEAALQRPTVERNLSPLVFYRRSLSVSPFLSERRKGKGFRLATDIRYLLRPLFFVLLIGFLRRRCFYEGIAANDRRSVF